VYNYEHFLAFALTKLPVFFERERIASGRKFYTQILYYKQQLVMNGSSNMILFIFILNL
jgi:hypothetical protein